jgi:MFS family permease
VGYVELGTDSWISNITGRILESKSAGLWLFIWTSGLMFVLRFFAGPIVHKINPLGLLFISAICGTIGLYLLGTTTTLAMCVIAATIYGLGKTFYWPTMLGVASERFPKGGALVLGIMGGVGMLSAGLLGGPIIGYKQDYFTTQKLEESNKAAYDRFKVEKPGAPYGFLPAIAGLDGSKVAILEDYEKNKDKPDAKLGYEKDLERVKGQDQQKNKALLDDLTKLNDWWTKDEKPNAAADLKDVVAARMTGGQKALLVTALVPATMAIGYLLLILYFRATGGYKQEHIGH